MLDPYSVLGISRNASQAELKQTYRRLAKELHPDRQPKDSAAAERFKDVAAAYQVLGDSKQRNRFDRGEIDAYGNRRRPFKRQSAKPKGAKQRANSRTPAPGKSGARDDRFSPGEFQASASSPAPENASQNASAGGGGAKDRGEQKSGFENFGFGGFSASDLFQPFFRHKRATDKDDAAGRGADQRYRLEIGLLDAIKGGKKASPSMPAGTSWSPSRSASRTVRSFVSEARAKRRRTPGRATHWSRYRLRRTPISAAAAKIFISIYR
jgi:DnaJ-class molecular chaperone